jgi:hypothetical protein
MTPQTCSGIRVFTTSRGEGGKLLLRSLYLTLTVQVYAPPALIDSVSVPSFSDLVAPSLGLHLRSPFAQPKELREQTALTKCVQEQFRTRFVVCLL